MRKLKQVPTMPTTGQFVAVYVAPNGNPFSITCQYRGGTLLEYNPLHDDWHQCMGMERMFDGSIFYISE